MDPRLPPDDQRLRDPCHRKDDRSFEGRADANTNTRFMMTRESLHLDVEDIHARRKSRETQLPSGARGCDERAANQRRRADADDGPGNDTAVRVFERANQRT